MSKKHVAVLMGGLSAERSVSLRSGAACAAALEGEGFKVTRVDVGHDSAGKLTTRDEAFDQHHVAVRPVRTRQFLRRMTSLFTHNDDTNRGALAYRLDDIRRFHRMRLCRFEPVHRDTLDDRHARGF